MDWIVSEGLGLISKFVIGVQMDVNTRSTSRSASRGRTRGIDGYTLYFLSLDGTIATVKKKPADDAFELTVEVRDRKGRRKVSAEAAQDPRSPEFLQAVREVKAELLARGRNRRRIS